MTVASIFASSVQKELAAERRAIQSVHDRIMAAIQEKPLGRAELAGALGYKGISGALRRAVDDLLHAEFLSYTVPEKPASRLQRYRAVQGDIKGTKRT